MGRSRTLTDKVPDNLQIRAESPRHIRRDLLQQRTPGPDKRQVGEHQVFIAAAQTNLHTATPSLGLHFQQKPRFSDTSFPGHKHQTRLTAHRFCKAMD